MYIFLDIDGVLNTHDPHPNGYNGIHPDKVYRLNRIVRETGARLVLSSVWRYMIHGGETTLLGFKYLLMIHGLDRDVELAGYTVKDEATPGRSRQIAQWLKESRNVGTPYVVIDDGSDLPPKPPETGTITESLFRHHGIHWVKTKSHLGLTEEDADYAIRILKSQEGRNSHEH